MNNPEGRIIELPKITDPRGNLTFAENIRNIPFDVKRVYWVYDVPSGENRGGHAHKCCREFIIAVSGSFTVTLDNGHETKTFLLNHPYQGLLVETGIWRTLNDFSSGSVCLVLASDFFDENDYIRNYNDYLEYTKEILNRGKLASVKEGNYIGSVAPFGYQKAFIDKSPTLVPDPIEAPAIELIFDLFVRKDLGWTKTARALDQMGIAPRRSHYWNPSQIKTILTNPVYTGKVTWNHYKSIKVVENGKLRKSRPIAKDYMIIDGKHPALISEELFQKAQEKLGRNTREPFSKELVNPLAGLLYCKNCGTAMTRRTYRQPDGSARSVPRLLCNNQSHCGTKSATFDSVYSALLLALRNTIQDFHIKIQQDDTLSAYTAQRRILATLEAELARLESRQEELYDLLEDGIYSKEVFLKRNEKLAESRSELEAKIKKAKENAPRPINYQERIIKFEQVLQALQDEAVPPKEKNRLLKQIIRRIDYSRDSTNRTRWDTSKPVLEIHFKEF